jgi:hypothetical protein
MDKYFKKGSSVKSEISPADGKPMLPAVPSRKPKCYNCKHASSAFEIEGKIFFKKVCKIFGSVKFGTYLCSIILKQKSTARL